MIQPKQSFRHVRGDVEEGNEKVKMAKTTFLPLKLVHIHSNGHDVKDHHQSTYNVGNHHNTLAAA